MAILRALKTSVQLDGRSRYKLASCRMSVDDHVNRRQSFESCHQIHGDEACHAREHLGCEFSNELRGNGGDNF